MAEYTPVKLLGDTLGQRHRHLNSLVRAAGESGTTVQDVEAEPEQSAVDRLFKIDLAVSLRDADYILRNLKHDDMLFVSRALKARWLLDRHDIINPKYLENTLFPEMIFPAVSKMKHWLYINLRDPAKCQEFYEYYKQNSFEFAIKFLSHCSNHFILEEVPKILTKLSPHYLKVLCEKCPTVAKIYYDSLATQDDVKNRYLKQEQSYYNSIKCVLKSDADVFLDVTENYFNLDKFSRFSPLATDYIMRYHRSRVISKLGLYVAHVLHIPTLAAKLSVDECQDVVLQLARASYLQYWFQYKAVEPLIKRLHPQKRAAFKKRIFVLKDIGECIQEWPYPTPKSPPQSDTSSHIFDDINYTPFTPTQFQFKRMIKKRKCGRYMACDIITVENNMKTDLQRLFEEFRFIGFDRALHDLGQRLRSTGSADRRRDIFLVLISKTGGRNDAVSALLQLAARHSNEPVHIRAAVVRSLVKRAAVWRLPADVWQNLLNFGRGLGLDGTPSEAACYEGLHAVIIRQLLAGECEPKIINAFLNNFSSLKEYSLKVDERLRIAVGLQNLLVAAAAGMEPARAVDRLNQLLDVIEVYGIQIQTVYPVIEIIKSLALSDENVVRPLIERLYKAKIGRQELLRENLKLRCDEAALLNALRHDLSALETEQIVNIIARGGKKFDRFISKLVIYFTQNEQLPVYFRTTLREMIASEDNEKGNIIKQVRSLVCLSYQDFEKNFSEVDAIEKKNDTLRAALRACAHRARPVVNLAKWGWSRAGAKAVATRAMRCREIEKAEFIHTLATDRRTVRVALALNLRSEGEPVLDTFTSAAKLRPVAALRVALRYFRHYDTKVDVGVWKIIKPLLSNVDLSSKERLRNSLKKIQWIPSAIKPDYCSTLYFVLEKILDGGSEVLLREICILLPEVEVDTIETILTWLFEKIGEDVVPLPYPAMMVRYLMLSTNDEDLERRFTKIGDRFLECLSSLRCDKASVFKKRLHQTINSLKYNAAFLDNKYSLCLSVIEKILTWLQTLLPKEENFPKYVQIHLTMLYFRAVRQSMKQMPEVFADPKRKRTEGVEAVGFVFGRYIAKEVAELVTTYFDSIIELYTGALVDYLGDFADGSSRGKFIESLLKGMLAGAEGTERRMAVYVLKDRSYDVKNEARKELERLLIQDKFTEVFVHAELLN
ncbi:uncharacterized protein LOC111357956 [Spodoptera litura]|uniref:Uncharacterized protein LOC111357956 n=1 Tax=Spodoptera litura TaxID=69820 RepID=A0A9J7IWU9_SPOLT|nr:uncharacterized protein LOC111357956 [Spodoptera litura]XP_022828540.1 uncharacterized protein LOC111357956 [Spodoptera litura]